MMPQLEAAEVSVVTVSTDSSSEIRLARGAHGLQAVMLADPQLEITDRFGYRNKNLNNFKPIPTRPGLPVPTTLLINEEGRVVWKDQTDNYTQRSDPEVVGRALAESFSTSG